MRTRPSCPTRPWRRRRCIIVDHALGTAACAALVRAAQRVPRRIVLITPAMRGELDALKEAGFTGYLIKPVRAASLAARFALEAEYGAARTSIVALTANASTEDRDACLEAGMDGFLVKPLDRERLAAALTASGSTALAA